MWIILSLLLFSHNMCVLSADSAAAQKQNIIVILADDLGFNDVSFRGSNLIPTPNIDALANAGVLLNRHYVLPSCTPSRSALLTGLLPIRLGTQGYPLKGGQPGGIPSGIKLMPEFLRELGYKTHMVGKWHVGYKTESHLPINRGFDTFFGYLNGYIDFYRLDYNQTLGPGGETFHGYDFRDSNGPRWDLQGQYATNLFTDEAVKIIRNHRQEDPLFLYVSHLAAHTGADDEDEGLQPPPGVEPDQDFCYIEKKERRNYGAIVKSLDDSVGRILEALHDANILEHSLILFMSDNGAPTVATQDTPPNFGSNWPLRGVKMTLFEGGVRGAAVIWSKSLPRNKIHESVMHITDWLPTFLSIANGTNADLDGEDQWHHLQEDISSKPARNILLNIDEKENSEAVLVRGRWKVVKQNMRQYANCDYHYYVQPNSPLVPELSPQHVINSAAGIALQGVGVTFSNEDVTRFRNNARVTCNLSDLHDVGWVEPSTDFLCKDYCVYDVLLDPCELTPLNVPEIQEEGRIFLDYWRPHLVPQNDDGVDEKSNPRQFDGAWSPWLENYAALIGMINSAASYSMCAKASWILVITGLIAIQV